MSSTNRASWSRKFQFSVEQKTELETILKRREGDKIQEYIGFIERKIPELVQMWGSIGRIPSEPPRESLTVLKNIARHARALESALKELDITGSEPALIATMSRIGRGYETFEYLKQDLPLLYISADNAGQFIAEPKRGRPGDEVERHFIAIIGKQYKTLFKRNPSYSKNTEFPNLVRTVLEIALPGNQHATKDNSKIIAASLTASGLINKQ